MPRIRGGLIPASWPASLRSSIGIYFKGIDCLEAQWTRTRLFLQDPKDVDAVLEFFFWRRNLLVWTCCTIENFVNDEGLSWLGEEFFKQNIERLDVTKKISVLYALKYRRLLASHPVLKEVKRLFELRNQLVHPKARFTSKNSTSHDSSTEVLKQIKPIELRKSISDVIQLFMVEPRARRRSKAAGVRTRSG